MCPAQDCLQVPSGKQRLGLWSFYPAACHSLRPERTLAISFLSFIFLGTLAQCWLLARHRTLHKEKCMPSVLCEPLPQGSTEGCVKVCWGFQDEVQNTACSRHVDLGHWHCALGCPLHRCLCTHIHHGDMRASLAKRRDFLYYLDFPTGNTHQVTMTNGLGTHRVYFHWPWIFLLCLESQVKAAADQHSVLFLVCAPKQLDDDDSSARESPGKTEGPQLLSITPQESNLLINGSVAIVMFPSISEAGKKTIQFLLPDLQCLSVLCLGLRLDGLL